MSQTRRMFRVFVSSTFSDLKAERNALQARVFPRLRALCEEHDAHFQPIDLRWGVSDEASLDQQAMNICLGEIERCQQISPRPNFIVLLGDRYGWCPLPSQIPNSVFNKIIDLLHNDDDLRVIKEWYFLDKNAVPAEWRLLPRKRGSVYEDPSKWQKVEYRLHTIFDQATKNLPLSEKERLPYFASATEQEIANGALDVENASDHVFCFFRNTKGFPQQFDGEKYFIVLNERLESEYPKGIGSECENLVSKFLENKSLTTPAEIAHWILQEKENIPSSTLQEDVLNLFYQVLVDTTGKDFYNLNEEDWTIDSNALDNQNKLKNRLIQHLPGNIKNYSVNWLGDGISKDHIDQICEDVFNSLANTILKELKNPQETRGEKKKKVTIQSDQFMDDEGLAHLKFAEERLEIFVGRTKKLERISDYCNHMTGHIFSIVGTGGTGKTALMSKAVQKIQKAYPNAQMVFRFIGATPDSSDGRNLLDSLCREISRRYDKDVSDIPTDYRDLILELGKQLQLATSEKPLILFLDSLDQLSASQGARNLSWLPIRLPEHVSLIVSTRGGEFDTYQYLKAKNIIEEELAGLTKTEGDELLDLLMENINRTLTPDQKGIILEKFVQSECNPLYLKMAFEEARLWTSYEEHIEDLKIGINGIIEKNMIDRLENESNHGEKIVSRTLGYLTASREGLSEDEIVDLLSRDLQVYQWFFMKSKHVPSDLLQSAIKYRREHGYYKGEKDGEPSSEEERAALAWLKEIRNPPEKVSEFLEEALKKTDGPRLPIVLWSRLSFDLAPYLTERMVDGSPLLYFYHRELGDVSKAVYLAGEKEQIYHTNLADYFQFKADPNNDRSWSGNYVHGLRELPYHLTSGHKYDGVFETLTDFKFLEEKAAKVGVLENKNEQGETQNIYLGVLQLQEDYEYALMHMSGGEVSESWGDRPPLILTAIETSKGLMVHCPVCNQYTQIRKEMLNSVITCPHASCNASIKLNPFTVKREI